jgi:hypothetical protein
MESPSCVTRPARLIENRGGTIAVVLGGSTGKHTGNLIWELRKNLSPSARKPYWISGGNQNWVGKGRCLLHHRFVEGFDEYFFTEFALFETKAPYNPEGNEFTYIVEVEETKSLGWFKSETIIHEISVKAISGQAAREKIASNPYTYGINSDLIRVCGARPTA